MVDGLPGTDPYSRVLEALYKAWQGEKIGQTEQRFRRDDLDEFTLRTADILRINIPPGHGRARITSFHKRTEPGSAKPNEMIGRRSVLGSSRWAVTTLRRCQAWKQNYCRVS